MQRLTVRLDINTISQSAHDEHVGTALAQVLDEFPNKILPVRRTFSRAYNADHTMGIEADRPSVIQHQRGIVALAQPLGIIVVGKGDGLNGVTLVVGQLFLGTAERCVDVTQALTQLG